MSLRVTYAFNIMTFGSHLFHLRCVSLLYAFFHFLHRLLFSREERREGEERKKPNKSRSNFPQELSLAVQADMDRADRQAGRPRGSQAAKKDGTTAAAAAARATNEPDFLRGVVR